MNNKCLNKTKLSNILLLFFLFTESTFKLAVVARGCIEDADISEEKCKNIPADSLVEYCEICDTDGCNSAAQYGPLALLIVSCLIKLFSIAHVH